MITNTEKLLYVKLLLVNLRLFDNTQTTESEDLSAEMKTFYSDYLIDNAVPNLVHDQFAQNIRYRR